MVDKYSSYVSFQHPLRKLTIFTDVTCPPSWVPTEYVVYICIIAPNASLKSNIYEFVYIKKL